MAPIPRWLAAAVSRSLYVEEERDCWITMCVTYRSSMVAPSSCPCRLVSIANRTGKGLKKTTLFSIQVRREDDVHFSIEVAELVWLSQNRHTLPAQSERLAVLCSRR